MDIRLVKKPFQKLTRSSAVAVIADRTAYDVRYSYRPLSGIAMVSISIYIFVLSKSAFDA